MGLYFFFVSFLVLASGALSDDSKFLACAPRNCGYGPNITYPFWVSGKHPSYCGTRGFEITCTGNYPYLKVAGEDYVVSNISYPNQTFLAVPAAVYQDKCPVPLRNYTQTSNSFASSTENMVLVFFYNCTQKPDRFTYAVDCAGNDTHQSFAALSHQDLVSLLNYSFGSCQSIVNVPIDMDDIPDDESWMEMNYTQILKLGALFNWTDGNCSDCRGSGGHCGYENTNFACFCTDGSHASRCDDGSKRDWTLKAVIGTCAGLGGIIVTCVLFIVCIYRHKRKSAPSVVSRNASSELSSKPDIEKASYYGIRMFTFDELEEATNNFDEGQELGDGGFGTVYYGKLGDGRSVAVKRLYENNYKRAEQFMNEVVILARLRHQNLVTLYGCTSRRCRELLLVYEYIPNGTVADHLHGERAKPGSLPWGTRLKIALETASALAYLHASDIIHRDVKTTNILLDNNFSVKVADFGLSRLFPTDVTHVSTAPQGTPGYVDPEYHQCYQLTDKSDVYSFGVVLVELISSKPAVDITRHRHEINLSNMAINKILNHALHELVDPSLGYESDYRVRRMITAVAELAFRCLQNVKDMRPSMAEVLDILKGIQVEEYNKQKPSELDIPADDAVLLKNDPRQSPDSVTVRWLSSSTTPNSSG